MTPLPSGFPSDPSANQSLSPAKRPASTPNDGVKRAWGREMVAVFPGFQRDDISSPT
jgi:hypothetical protein